MILIDAAFLTEDQTGGDVYAVAFHIIFGNVDDRG